MNENHDLHVVLGTAAAGQAVIRALAARGKRVRAVSRSGKAVLPREVESVAADLSDRDEARRACAGATVVYTCTGAPYSYRAWADLLPRMMDAAIEGAATAGARLVYADNLYMYGKVSGPITEELPDAPASRKGEVRAKVAQMLLGAHAAGKVRATIGRASDFFGPHALSSVVGERTFRAILTGKQANWIGDLDVPHSLTFIDNFGQGLITLGERDEALGSVWHIPTAEALTGRQFLELVFAELGAPPRIGVIKRPLMQLAGLFVPFVRETTEMLYQFEGPHLLDGSKYIKTFGHNPATPHPEAIRRTLAWYHEYLKG